MYLKLPRWFTVPTPIGNYNPDWAIVMETRDEDDIKIGEDRLYLVRETKDDIILDKLHPDEEKN